MHRYSEVYSFVQEFILHASFYFGWTSISPKIITVEVSQSQLLVLVCGQVSIFECIFECE